MSKTNLGNNGYTLVLEQALDDITYLNHITTLRSYCTASTILCLAGGVSYSDTLLTIACGNCLQITTQTAVNSPVFYGGAYWYFTNSYSIGYAPTSAVSMTIADTFDGASNQRLSFHLDGVSGGYRIGTYTYNNAEYAKYFYFKYGIYFLLNFFYYSGLKCKN